MSITEIQVTVATYTKSLALKAVRSFTAGIKEDAPKMFE
jgi:hypothetical protein